MRAMRAFNRDPELSCPCRRVVVYPKCGSEAWKISAYWLPPYLWPLKQYDLNEC